METVPHLLESAAQWQPDRPMLVQGGQSWSYREVNAWANRISRVIAEHPVRGEPVALFLPSRPVFVAAYYAVLKAGGIAAPLNAMFTPTEVADMIDYLGASVAITTPEGLPTVLEARLRVPALTHVFVWAEPGAVLPAGTANLADLVADQPDDDPPPATHNPTDVATIFHTSGTTGRPKGAAQTHVNIVAGGRQMVTHAGWRLATEHLVCPLPLFNNFGSTAILNMAVTAVATLTLVERWDAAEVLAALTSGGATRMVGTPTMFIYLLEHHDSSRGPQLRLDPCIVGGQTTPTEVRDAFEQRFATRLLNLYGATETHAVTLTPLHGAYPECSVGQPIGQSTVTVVDDAGHPVSPGMHGELVLGGDTVCAGYWRDPQRSSENFCELGWRSGDIGFRDAAGYVHVVDRKKDLIITGGANIYPGEVEAVLYQHPDVALAAVIGVPDPAKGEIPKAYVVARPGSALDAEALIAFARTRLAAYKCPREVALVEELPTSPVGKILKRELREAVLAGGAAEWGNR